MGNKADQKAIASHVSGQSNTPLSKPAHALSYDDLVEEIGANKDDGLATEEAKKRLQQFGKNELGDEGGVNPGKILLTQIANAMTLVCVYHSHPGFLIY